MKRREWIGCMTALAFSGLSAYANKKEEFLPKGLFQEEEKQTESWTQGSAKFFWIRDNAEEKRMPNQLFTGADQKIINQLSPEGGALASISCFLVQPKLSKAPALIKCSMARLLTSYAAVLSMKSFRLI